MTGEKPSERHVLDERDTTGLVVLYRSLRDGVTADVGRAIAMATGGVLAFAPIEYGLTLWAYVGETELSSKLRLVPLTLTLTAILWLGLVLALAAGIAGTRLVRARFDPAAGRGAGLFALSPLRDGVRPGVPIVWATLATTLAFALLVQRAAAWAFTTYKEPQLTAAVVAFVCIAIAVAAMFLHRLMLAGARVAAAALTFAGPWNPLARWRACGVALAGLVGVGLAVCWYLVPLSRSYLPVRLVISATIVALGAGLGLRYIVRPRPVRKHALRLAGTALALSFVTLVHWGGEPETKYIAVTASPALDRLIGVVRFANDVDRDGYGSLLGEADCDPWRAAIHPGDAIDHPDDGIDQNCDGHDFSLSSLHQHTGPARPLPPAFQRDWNFLFITIDTVRYDHTSFGGYATGPKKRDTTPRLANLVEKSTSFVYAQSPSAGTMASIPAILTSKFFHSGIALDEKRPAGTPPGILPENTLLPEIMKRGGYRTGVIGSHEWWTGWGLEQGVDDYDNSIGAKPDAKRVVADKITDRAIAWISRQQGRKWFLWAHYIDPHGHYIAHPEVADYGTSDPDLYDSELAWTDQEVGRLLDELTKLPSYAKTIVVITSDHGENMGEHNGVIGTHGTALYKEQLHVPLIVFIPGHAPREVRGAVTNLDVVPTIAALARIDVADLTFEGRSLVPQLFYREDDRDRIVFAETNAPAKQRAAISERFKLIHHLASHVYELYDTIVDPGETANLAPKDPEGFGTMKRALQMWMERVMYARDPLFNQAFRQIADVVLTAAPTPPVPTEGHIIDGKLEILGIGPADGKPWTPGARTDIHVYFRVLDPVAIPYRFSLNLWQAAPGPLTGEATITHRGPTRATAEGAYPASRWRKGDFIRERFPFNIPADWKDGVAVGLVVMNPSSGLRIRATGPAPANEPNVHALGVIPLGSTAPTPP